VGVTVLTSTLTGGQTPICNNCGICLCYDISGANYAEAMDFWDEWICEDCNGGVKLSLKSWKKERGL
jgi:hypothetical protein